MITQTILSQRAMNYLESLTFFAHPVVFRLCLEALDSLNKRLNSVDQCMLIFQVILEQQMPREDALARTITELRYECLVADYSGDRSRTAMLPVEGSDLPNAAVDELLDMYDERINRFKDFFCLFGHPYIGLAGKPIQLRSE